MQQFENDVKNYMEKSGAIGLIVSAFKADGTVLYEKSFGYSDKKKQTVLNNETICGVASMSKSFTIVAILQLVEKGIINLDEPVKTYLPEFENVGNGVLKIRDFFSHAGGFFPLKRTIMTDVLSMLNTNYDLNKEHCFDAKIAKKATEVTVSKYAQETTYTGSIGENASYSNDTFGLLSEIVRRHGAENSFAEYVKKNIFEPLGMMRTTVEFILPLLDENVQTQYMGKDGVFDEYHDFYNNASALMGGGSIKSTINDLQKYIRFFLTNDETKSNEICNSELIEAMMQPTVRISPTVDYGWGLSVEKVGTDKFIGHGGALTGVSSNMLWSKKQQVGVVVLCNTSNVPVALIAKELLCTVLNMPKPVVEIPPVVMWTVNEKTAIIGKYESKEGDTIEVVEAVDDNSLVVTIENVTYPLITTGVGVAYFEGKFAPTILQFFYNETGQSYAIRHGYRMLPKK